MNKLIKKIFYFVVFLLITVSLTSCVIVTDDEQKFVDKLYQKQIGEISGLVIDLREKGDEETPSTYAYKHISGAVNFDINENTDFQGWLEKITTPKSTIYLVDSGNNEYEAILSTLKELGYKKIVIYTKGYETLRNSLSFNEAIYESSGLEDCGCD